MNIIDKSFEFRFILYLQNRCLLIATLADKCLHNYKVNHNFFIIEESRIPPLNELDHSLDVLKKCFLRASKINGHRYFIKDICICTFKTKTYS